MVSTMAIRVNMNKNGNVEYMALQFPISPLGSECRSASVSLLATNLGLFAPAAMLPITESYNGTGGLTNFYGGASYDIWKKLLSVGANIDFYSKYNAQPVIRWNG